MNQGMLSKGQGKLDNIVIYCKFYINFILYYIHRFHFEFFSWAYLSRLAFSILIMIIAVFINTFSSVIAGYRTPNLIILDLNNQKTDKVILPDLGHDFIAFIL